MHRTQDFEFHGCRNGTCTSITKTPADSITSIPVTGPILFMVEVEDRERTGEGCVMEDLCHEKEEDREEERHGGWCVIERREEGVGGSCVEERRGSGF